MKRSFSITMLSIAVFLIQFSWMGCNNTTTKKAAGDEGGGGHAMATITGTMPDTTVTGTVHFEQEGKEVSMKLELTIPSKANQSLAVHIHENGSCGDMGKEAGGHWNPTTHNHGKWGSSDFHGGDIGNIQLDAEGKGSLKMETDLWSIGGDATNNIVGKSIIVHTGMDDFTTQPTGNAGGRIGCGVISQSSQ